MTTRRTFLLSLAAAPLAGVPAGHGSMMWDYVVGRIRALDEERRKRLASATTAEQIWLLQQRVRARLARMWGPFPGQRTPLNARLVGSLERNGYVVEKLVYESRPSFFVTANLYRPQTASGRLPAVIFPPGHTAAGKVHESYEKQCILLARNGFVVLTWDPIGQGERLQLWDAEKRRSLAGRAATAEHDVLGKQCYLLGISLMQYRVWDAMRAIDYLESRDDVDAARIGCAGQSGGGMETLQLAPFETRIQAAVSVCAVSTFRDKTEALLIADPEQNLYGTLGYGIDHPELLATVAPRPMLIGSALRDFVPIEGARRTYQEVRHVYDVLGCPGKLGMFTTDDQHSLNQEMREAAATWLVRWLAGRNEAIHESAETVPAEADLRCTATGQVADSLGGETVGSLNLKLADRMAPQRELPSTPGQYEVYRREIAQLVTRITRVDVEGHETGITVPVRSSGPAGPVVVVVAESGKDDPALLRDIVRPLADAGHRVVGLDVRGWGETLPSMPAKKDTYPWDEFFAYRSLELGRPLFGQRLRDVLVTAPAAAGGNGYALVGIGAGALLAAHAAVLEPRIRSVVALSPLLSYRCLLEDPMYRQPFSSFLPGVIAAYEVRDVLAAIAPRRLLVLNPEDAERRPAGPEVAAKQFHWAGQVYRAAGASNAFALHSGVSSADLGPMIARWLASA